MGFVKLDDGFSFLEGGFERIEILDNLAVGGKAKIVLFDFFRSEEGGAFDLVLLLKLADFRFVFLV